MLIQKRRARQRSCTIHSAQYSISSIHDITIKCKKKQLDKAVRTIQRVHFIYRLYNITMLQKRNNFMSCIFMPCYLIWHFDVLHFQPPPSPRLNSHIRFTIMYGIHTGRCPAYLKDIVRTSTSAATRTGLRSASGSKYMTPRLRTKLGERSFSHAGPAAWNSLPPDIRAAASPAMFKKLYSKHTFLTQHFPPVSF